MTLSIKCFTKQMISNAAKALHEYVGVIVVFPVDITACLTGNRPSSTTFKVQVEEAIATEVRDSIRDCGIKGYQWRCQSRQRTARKSLT